MADVSISLIDSDARFFGPWNLQRLAPFVRSGLFAAAGFAAQRALGRLRHNSAGRELLTKESWWPAARFVQANPGERLRDNRPLS